MTDLSDFARLVARDHGLCVVSTLRPDATIQSSVVNAGVLGHPVTGEPVVGLVAWEWVAAEGPADLAGPDDKLGDLDADGVRLLLRQIFTACGGTHDDWDTYDRVMAEEHRTGVLVTPERIYPSA
jgi:hypothetical protein